MSLLQTIPDALKFWSWQEPAKIGSFSLNEGNDPWDVRHIIQNDSPVYLHRSELSELL